MHQKASKLHDALAVLAPPRRFQLMLLMLAGVDRSVSQLAESVGLSQSCTSRHLQALERAGLLKRVRDGKRVVFGLAPRDEAARAVVASLSGSGSPAARGAAPRRRASARGPAGAAIPAARERLRPRRAGAQPAPGRRGATGTGRAQRPTPAVADGPAAPDSRSEPESGITSAPATEPAWRRSEIEDFLL